MPEPVTITLAAVGTVALTEGVKFLYGQAAELLKRWRERRDAAKTTPSKTVEPAVVELPADVFEGQLSAPQIHYDKLTKVEPRLKELVGKIALIKSIRARSTPKMKTCSRRSTACAGRLKSFTSSV